MNKQKFIEKMNQKSKYYINFSALDNLIKNINDIKESLQDTLTKALIDVDITDKKAVLSRLTMHRYNIDKITVSNLMNLFDETNDETIEQLATYYRSIDKLAKLNGFKNNLSISKEDTDNGYEVNSTSMSPVFALNSVGGISISKPSLPLNKDEIKEILSFNYALDFDNLDEIIKFFRKYNKVVCNLLNQSSFLILGTTLYANIIDDEFDIIPFSDDEEEVKEQIKEFNKEFNGKAEDETEYRQESGKIEAKEEQKAKDNESMFNDGDETELQSDWGHFIINFSKCEFLKADFNYLMFLTYCKSESDLSKYTRQLFEHLVPPLHTPKEYSFNVDNKTACVTASFTAETRQGVYQLKYENYNFSIQKLQ